MFHIKSDKRSQTSATLIVEGFYVCLQEKDFSKITISDIQRTSSVGRATFYRLFDSMPDILAYECDRIFQELVEQGERLNPINPKDAFTYFFQYWTKNITLMRAIADSGHLEIFSSTFRTYADSIGRIMIPDSNLNESEDFIDYFISALSSVMVSIITTWMKHGQNLSAEELTEIFMKTISFLKTPL